MKVLIAQSRPDPRSLRCSNCPQHSGYTSSSRLASPNPGASELTGTFATDGSRGRSHERRDLTRVGDLDPLAVGVARVAGHGLSRRRARLNGLPACAHRTPTILETEGSLRTA